MDILFKNVTAVLTMSDESPVLKNVCVGVDGGKIKYVGQFNETLSASRVIDCTQKLLMPALTNCHAHTPMSILRGYANDIKLKEWLFDHIFPAEQKFTDEMVYLGATLSIAEMVASGTVAFSDMYLGLPQIARAVVETGVKASISNGVITFDPNFDFLSCKEYKESICVLSDYHKKGDGRVRLDASIHGEYTSFDRAWHEVVEFAKQNSLHMHIHLSETKHEHEACKEKYGMTPTEVFYKNGVFDVPVIAAHGVWLEENDMEILAKCGATVVHNPVSNLKLASGIAPVAKMVEKGVNVALGTDGVASNNTQDLFEEIKLAAILQKASCDDPTVIPAYEALKMATVNGAKAQGRGGESGIIKEGFDADIILLDLNTPSLTPIYDYPSAVTYSATGRDVCLTMCNGKVLYENGTFTTIDVEKLIFQVNNVIKQF